MFYTKPLDISLSLTHLFLLRALHTRTWRGRSADRYHHALPVVHLHPILVLFLHVVFVVFILILIILFVIVLVEVVFGGITAALASVLIPFIFVVALDLFGDFVFVKVP